MGLDRDKSTQALLTLFKPGMINIVSHAKRRNRSERIDFEDMLTEMMSFAIESVIRKYRIGELNPITNFLFDPNAGYLIKWSKWYITRTLKFDVKHQLMGTSPYGDDQDIDAYIDPSVDPDDNHKFTRDVRGAIAECIDEAHFDALKNEDTKTMAEEVMDIIEDGVTLNANEYRVLKFCLQNANESNEVRMVDGLHIHMANAMGVSRPRVTRLYKRGKDKLIQACLHIKKEYL